MTDESLIDEMRAAIQGDRERAGRRRTERRSSPPEPDSLPTSAPQDPALHTESATADRGASWSRWLRPRRRH